MIRLPSENELRISHIGHGLIIVARRIQLRSPTLHGGGTPYIVLTGGGRAALLCSLYSFGYWGASREFRELRKLLGLNGERARAISAAPVGLKWVRRRASGGWLYGGLLSHPKGLELVLVARRRDTFALVGGLRLGSRGRKSVKLRACRLTAKWWHETMKPQTFENWDDYSERIRKTVTGWGFPQILVDAAIGKA